MKVDELNAIMENVLFDEIKNRILSESKGGMEKYHVTCEGEPVMTCNTQEEAEEHVDKLAKEHPGKQFIIEKSNYESHSDMLEKLDKMGEELEETENKDMKEELKGGQKKLDKNHNGKIDGQDFKILRGQKQDTKEEEQCDECGDGYMKEELKGGQTKLDKNKNGKIDGDDFKKLRNAQTEDECMECGSSMEESDASERKAKSDKELDYSLYKFLKNVHKDTPENKIPENHKNTMNDLNDKYSFDKLKSEEEVSEDDSQMCSECGGYMNEDGSCGCGKSSVNESKKKTLRLTESELIKLIGKMVSEAAVPGLEVYKQAHTASGKENKENLSNVDKKIKGALSIPGATNPEFPKANTKGDKVADNNSKEEDDTVADQRGGTMLDLDYENEPSPEFKDRLKKALEGDATMGNSHDAGNVIKSDLGEKLAKVAKRKEEEEKNAPMYNKDPQPVKIVKESKSETDVILENEIKKMKMMYGYDKKTQ